MAVAISPAGFQAYSRNPVLSSPNAAWRSRRGQWLLRRICQCLDCRPEVFLLPPPPERGAEEKQRHSCLGAWTLPPTRWLSPCRPCSWVTCRGRQLGGTVCGAPTHTLGQAPPNPQAPGWTSEPLRAPEPTLEAFPQEHLDSSSHQTSPSAEENRSAQRRKQQCTVGAPEDTRGSHGTGTHVSFLHSPRGGAFPVLQTSCPDGQSVRPVLPLGGVQRGVHPSPTVRSGLPAVHRWDQLTLISPTLCRAPFVVFHLFLALRRESKELAWGKVREEAGQRPGPPVGVAGALGSSPPPPGSPHCFLIPSQASPSSASSSEAWLEGRAQGGHPLPVGLWSDRTEVAILRQQGDLISQK